MEILVEIYDTSEIQFIWNLINSKPDLDETRLNRNQKNDPKTRVDPIYQYPSRPDLIRPIDQTRRVIKSDNNLGPKKPEIEMTVLNPTGPTRLPTLHESPKTKTKSWMHVISPNEPDP